MEQKCSFVNYLVQGVVAKIGPRPHYERLEDEANHSAVNLLQSRAGQSGPHPSCGSYSSPGLLSMTKRRLHFLDPGADCGAFFSAALSPLHSNSALAAIYESLWLTGVSAFVRAPFTAAHHEKNKTFAKMRWVRPEWRENAIWKMGERQPSSTTPRRPGATTSMT